VGGRVAEGRFHSAAKTVTAISGGTARAAFSMCFWFDIGNHSFLQNLGDDMVDRSVPPLHFFGRENENIYRTWRRIEQQAQRRCPLVTGQIGIHDYEQVEIAARPRLAARARPEDHDLFRTRPLGDRFNDRANRCLGNAGPFHGTDRRRFRDTFSSLHIEFTRYNLFTFPTASRSGRGSQSDIAPAPSHRQRLFIPVNQWQESLHVP